MIFTSFSSQAGGGGSSCVLREAEVGSFKWLWQSECVLTCVCSCVTRKAYLTSETGTLCPLGQAAAPEWQTSTRQFSPTCRLTLFISDSCTHVNMTNEQWGLSLKIQSFHVPLWHQSIFPVAYIMFQKLLWTFWLQMCLCIEVNLPNCPCWSGFGGTIHVRLFTDKT